MEERRVGEWVNVSKASNINGKTMKNKEFFYIFIDFSILLFIGDDTYFTFVVIAECKNSSSIKLTISIDIYIYSSLYST